MLRRFQKPLEVAALIGGAITFGTAYYLQFLAHPAWSAAPFDAFLAIFQGLIFNIGGSQIVVSNIALISCVILFIMSRDWFWMLAVVMLLVSLPVTMFLLMPINLAFVEATDPELAAEAPQLLNRWGLYQIIRTVADGVAFIAMCKPVIWRKQS